MQQSRGPIAVVAAMKREVEPVIRNWPVKEIQLEDRKIQVHESPNCVVAYAGMGTEAARACAQALVQQYHPKLLVSYGLAGALDSKIQVGTVVRTSHVISSETSKTYSWSSENHKLLTAPSVADPAAKRAYAAQFGAHAVDMEAAAVAEVAARAGIPFIALKAISDELEFSLPPFNQFIQPDGSFRTGAFVRFVLFRPWLWPRVLKLARNTAVAIQALQPELQHLVDNHEYVLSTIESKQAFPGQK